MVMTSSSYQDWTHEVLNTHLRITSTVPTRTVDKYTRARKDGKIIVCPECNKVATVYHFSWSALGCQECGAMVEKNQWRLL